MTPIDQLILDAEQKRDAAIHQAHVDYNSAVREIRHLAEKLKRIHWQDKYPPRVLRPARAGAPFRVMTTIQAAYALLSEGQPMTAVEIVVAMQERGCRPNDDPEKLLRTVRENFRWHSDKFTQDAEGRWGVRIEKAP
jgi:pentatricopeptide repeat protein